MAVLSVISNYQESSALTASRLVVLVPSKRGDVYKLGRMVWTLAMGARCESVLYVSLVAAPGDEINISRQLVKLASVTRDPHLSVSTQIQFGASWPVALRKLIRPGDQILCVEDQEVRRWIARRDSLAGLVSRTLKMPVSLLR